MAYDVEKLTKLSHLKQLAQKVADDCATKVELKALTDRVDDLVTAGGEPNVITAIKVNGVEQQPVDKAVDITIPGYSIEKAAESGEYAAVYNLTKDGVAVGATINIPKDMVVESGSVVELADGDVEGLAAGTYIKLVLSNATNDTLYINVGNLIEYVTSGSVEGDMVVINIDETTHKVTATITDGTITKAKLHADLQTEIDNKVEKVEGKGLSTNDYTTEEKEKLAGISAGATKVAASTTAGNILIDDVETTVVQIATDAEVTEMLDEVFPAAEA